MGAAGRSLKTIGRGLRTGGAGKMETNDTRMIALGSRLLGVPEVLTLGVRPNFYDYSPGDRERILTAKRILYPTLNYAQFLSTMGKQIFPGLETYLYADEKIKQTTLFYLLGVPHPRTRVYYRRHHGDILRDFSFPFVGKLPRRSSRGNGVFRIDGPEALSEYLARTPVAYIQEFLPHERDLRVILIRYRPVLAYWRIRRGPDFRTNLHQGGRVCFDSVPGDAVRLAVDTARKCRFDDVGMDLLHSKGKWYVIEANMKYGRQALRMKGLDLKEILRRKLIAGELFGPDEIRS